MGSSPWPIPADAVSGTGASRIEGGLEVAARDLCFGHPQAFLGRELTVLKCIFM